jgi:exopolysaccharide production protein ExoQ
MATDPSAMKAGDRISVMEAAFVGVAFMFLPTAAYGNHGTVILLVVAGLASLWQVLRHGPRHWPLGRATTLGLGAFLAWGAASALWAESPGLVPPRVMQLAGLMATGVAILAALPGLSDRGRRRIGFAMVAGMIALIFAVVVDGGLGGEPERIVRRLLGLRIPEEWLRSHFKVSVTLCGILLPAAAVWLWRQRKPWLMVLPVTGLIGCGLTVGSNTGLAAAGIAGLVSLLALARPRLTAWGLAAVVAVAFLGAPMMVESLPPAKAAAESVSVMPNSMMHRLGIWTFTTGKVRERPVIGWGLDASRALPGSQDIIKVPVHSEDGGIVMIDAQAIPLHPHNLMLQVWLELGLVGVLMLLAPCLTLIATLARLPAVRAPGLGTLAGVLAVGALSFGAWQAWWVASQWLVAIFCLILVDSAAKDGAATKDGAG